MARFTLTKLSERLATIERRRSARVGYAFIRQGEDASRFDVGTLIYSGIPEAPRAECCTKESLQAAMPRVKADLSRWVEKGAGGHAKALASAWAELCQQFNIPE
jgi:hypothetical protein